MKPTPTRTIGPLHFEDLEPHRFEDLVRQLAYDFRNWVTLEAIGRTGDDGGVDIRCVETPARHDESEDAELDPDDQPRTWLIQVKRERRLGPARAEAVAAAAVFDEDRPPHGFILAAPTNMSRRTRDVLARALSARGVHQVIVWGLGELEDLLFDPSHDHLLFAYFGISLRVRQRSLTADLRNRLTKKRQIFKAVGSRDHHGHTAVLLRDPREGDYPFPERVEDFDPANPPWLWTAFETHSNPDTIALSFRRHHAWISTDRKSYDMLESCSHVMPHRHGFDMVPERDEELCERVWRYFHNEIPEAERAWVVHVGWIPLDNILLVDDLGDAFHEPPHLLVTRDHAHGYFTHVKTYLELEKASGTRGFARASEFRPIDEFKRGEMFPNPIPDVEWKSQT